MQPDEKFILHIASRVGSRLMHDANQCEVVCFSKGQLVHFVHTMRMEEEREQRVKQAAVSSEKESGWHNAVRAECEGLENCYVKDDPVKTLQNLLALYAWGS